MNFVDTALFAGVFPSTIPTPPTPVKRPCVSRFASTATLANPPRLSRSKRETMPPYSGTERPSRGGRGVFTHLYVISRLVGRKKKKG